MDKYIMFGAGKNAEELLNKSKGIFEFSCIIDNDEKKWGQIIDNIKIYSPHYLESMQYSGENIIISVSNKKFTADIFNQLQSMGFIYNENFFFAHELLPMGSAVPGHVSGYVDLPQLANPIKSFDPSSRLIRIENKDFILRCVSDESVDRYKKIYERCRDAKLFDKYIVNTTCSGNTYGLPYNLVLEHDFVTPISYCFEWSPKMFLDYTLFMTDMLYELSKADLGLCDGHALNATVSKGNFIFLDFGALKLGVTNRNTLIEFINTHLIPLVLFSKKEMEKAYLLLKNMGLQFTLADIQGFLSSEEINEIRGLYNQAIRTITQNDISEFIKKIKNCIKHFSSVKKKTRWDGYQNDEWEWSTDQNKWSTKMKNAIAMIEKTQPETITDLAGNMGWYGSYLHEKSKYSVIIDMDYNCVDYLWDKIRNLKIKNVIPITMSLCAPTLDYYRDEMIGETGIIPWREKATSRFKSEMVLAFAVVHHLAFAQQLTFDEIISQILLFTSKYLIIEFVEQTDKYITDFLKTGFEWYTKENFEKALKKDFEIIDIEKSTPEETRTLYLCRKKRS